MYSIALWLFSHPQEIFLKCEKHNGVEGQIDLLMGTRIIYVKNTERGCGSEYSYEELLDEKKGGVITSFPTSDDLGLSAKNIIYLVAQDGDEAVYAGEVPASATKLKPGVYEDILQSGGSIYKSVYVLDKGKVSTLYPVKELIVADSQCVYEKKNGKVCRDITGSFNRPLCVLDYGERKVKVDIAECSGMGDD
ncbi:hypothetical protein ACW9H6_28480 [Pseudomonas sp. SDO528_S397]